MVVLPVFMVKLFYMKLPYMKSIVMSNTKIQQLLSSMKQ